MAYVYSGDSGNTIEISYSEIGRKYLAAGNSRKLDVKFFGFVDNDINYNLSVDRVPQRGNIPDLTGVDNSNSQDFLCYNTLNQNLNVYETSLFSDENNDLKKGCYSFESGFCGEDLTENTFKLSNSIRFSSTNSHLIFPNNSLYNFDNNNNFVLETWFRILPNGLNTTQSLFNFLEFDSFSPNSGYYLTYRSDRRLEFNMSGIGVLIANTTTINPNVLYHVIVVKNGTNRNNWKIYINGIEQSLTVGNTGSATRIGKLLNGRMAIGVLPDLYPFLQSVVYGSGLGLGLNDLFLSSTFFNESVFDRMDILSSRIFTDVNFTNDDINYYYNSGNGNIIKDLHENNVILDNQYKEVKGSLIVRNNLANNLDGTLSLFKTQFINFNSSNPALREYE
jgi:hypothetical protein